MYKVEVHLISKGNLLISFWFRCRAVLITIDKQKARDRVTLDKWKGTVTTPRQFNDSIELFVEMRYLELKERERNSTNVPNKTKASLTADLLLKLCGTLGGHSVVLLELVYELLNCVFEDYSTSARSFSLEQGAEDFSAMKMFVEGYAEKCEQIEDLQQEIEWMKQGVKMKAIVKKFQCVRLVFDPSARFLRDTCFNMWKSMYVRTVSYKHLQIRRQLKHRVYMWKEYVRDKYLRIRNELRAARNPRLQSISSIGSIESLDSLTEGIETDGDAFGIESAASEDVNDEHKFQMSVIIDAMKTAGEAVSQAD
eukprot:gene33879-41792_t